MPTTHQPAALSPYRVLDLTQEGSALAARILADMGADVVKIEPPEGESGRRMPPFVDGAPHPEKSLFFFCCNLNKRGITLDLSTPDGRDALKRLAAGADFLFESFAPGYMRGLGLGYTALREINPRLIMVSITPFGQTGPYAQHRGPDIVPWAMGGYMWMCGDPDKPPVRPSVPPQAYFHAGATAAVAALIALARRAASGGGSYVDQSVQACGPWMMTHSYQFYELLGQLLKREGTWRHYGHTRSRTIFPCKDGNVVAMLSGGQLGGPSMNRLFAWMKEEGLESREMGGMDWRQYSAHTADQAMTDKVSGACEAFFVTRTKAELLRAAIERGIHLAPVGTIKDLAEDPHLAQRGFWVDVAHPELGRPLRYPGAPFISTETPWRVYRRPPLLGEHNAEVLGERRPSPQPSPRRGLLERGPDSDPLSHESSRGERVGVRVSDHAQRPLEGLKVVDLSGVVMGPTVTRILADYGATVVKVESAHRPDSLRTMTPYKDGVPGLNRSGYFSMYNAGKLSLTLNLKKPEALDLFKRYLVPWADVIVEAYMPGVMEEWGLDYEGIRKINPEIVYLRASLMGHSGPNMYLKGTGQITAALAGWYELTGWPDHPPVGPYSAYSDFISWNYALAAILAALDHRGRTGKGQYIDQALFESTIQFATPAVLDYTVNGVLQTRQGNRDARAAPHGAYPCAPSTGAGEGKGLLWPGGRGIADAPTTSEAWCVVAVATEDEWVRFVRAIGSPAWATDPRFATLAGRKAHEEELDALVGRWTSGHSAKEVTALLQAAGVPAGAVKHARDILSDPQLEHRGGFVVRDHPEMGQHSIYTSSFRIPGVEHEPWRAAPVLGQDNEQVCRDILGIPAEELANFIAAEALE